MQDEDSFKINLCTFMGRENNVKIIHRYIDKALSTQAIDRYYMIDMTRNISDHQFIYKEYNRLNKIYPNRVFIVNRKERQKELENGTVNSTIGYWSPFYKFLDNFTDDDVIIKLDDDSLFIDVSTIRAAARLRWKNKRPILMHSNCINNGITAFHQAKKGIWRFPDKEIRMYPPCGLTGPLFSQPQLAAKCHNQFTSDLISDPANLEKYKLKENIYFNSRVSINCVFMLGSDRKYFTNIDEQDEYITSSKIGQELDRPNMIIGDFITSHHTYGVQEPVTKQANTFSLYENLAVKWFKNNPNIANKNITFSFGPVSSIKNEDNYVNRAWIDSNSFVIQNCRSKKYMVLGHDTKPVIDLRTRKENGVLYLRTILSASDEERCAFNIDENIYTCTDLLTTKNPNSKENSYMPIYINRFFQKNYERNGINLHTQPDGSYLIESKPSPGMFLSTKEDKKSKNVIYFFAKKTDRFQPDSWNLISMKNHENKVLMSKIVREDLDKYQNDPTYAESAFDKSFPKMISPRGFYWMTRGHLWEFIKLQNENYHIKCIDDERESVWLSNIKNSPKTSRTPEEWQLIKQGDQYKIQCKKGLGYLKIGNSGELLLAKQPSLFTISI